MKTATKFLDRLDSAAFWEAWVASRIARAGLKVTMNPAADDLPPDLTVVDPISEMNRIAVEIKSRNLSFTSPDDYPYATVNLCSESYYKRTLSHPRHYLSVSQDTGAIVWVPNWVKLHAGVGVDGPRKQVFGVMFANRNELRSFEAFLEYCRG